MHVRLVRSSHSKDCYGLSLARSVSHPVGCSLSTPIHGSALKGKDDPVRQGSVAVFFPFSLPLLHCWQTDQNSSRRPVTGDRGFLRDVFICWCLRTALLKHLLPLWQVPHLVAHW